MLALPTTHPLHPGRDLAQRSQASEAHIRSLWTSVTSVHGVPGKPMLPNNFQELPHFPESFFPSRLHYPCQRAITSEGFALSCSDNRKGQYPVIQNHNVLINNPVRKTVRYTNHSFLPQERNITYNNNSNPAILNSVFQNQRHRNESLGSLVPSNKDNSSLRLKKVTHNSNSTKIKDVSDNQFSVRNYGRNNPSRSFLDINVTESESLKIVKFNGNEETRKSSPECVPSCRKKLGHSIASILNISPGHGDCVVSEVKLENNDSDSSYYVDNISDDNSSTSSDILVDDDVVVGLSRSDDDVGVELSRSDDDVVVGLLHCDDDENDQDMISSDSSINYKQSLLNNIEGSSNNEHGDVNSRPVAVDITLVSATSTSSSISSPDSSLVDDMKNDYLKNFGCLKTKENRDRVRRDDTIISQYETFTLHAPEEEEKVPQKINGTSESKNPCSDTKDNAYSSAINAKTIPPFPTNDHMFSTQCTVSRSKIFISSASSSNVLPPIQTLCQPYHKEGTNERSAFKPIRKLSTTSQQQSPFLTQYRSWTERNILPPNIHPPNRTTNANPAAMQTFPPEVHPSRQNSNVFITNKSQLEDIGVLRRKSSFYQSQGMPDVFLPASASLTTELLPSTLETWMTWLRQREANPVKCNKFQDRTTSRVPAPPRYHCEACSKTYSTFGGLSKHRQFHCTQHIKKEFACKVCNRAYSSLGALKMHIRTHTLPCRCQECGKAFSRPWLLQGHLRTHTGEKPFKCNHCGRAFADRSNLRAHLQTHAEIKRYACNKCGKTFSRMSLLTKHIEGSCPVNVKK